MTSKKRNKSYFLPYLRYKLSRKRPQMIIFALLNLITLILPVVLLIDPVSRMSAGYEEYLNNLGNYKVLYDLPFSIARENFNYCCGITLQLGVYAAIISVIMLTIITASSFKYYYNRAAMDTLGCLPLSYGDRFFGDHFSGLLTDFISFVPCFIISFIMTFIIEAPMKNFGGMYITQYPSFLRKFFISMLFIFISVHAVTSFISSCCGKLGNSVTFSFVTMLLIPGLFTGFGMAGYYDVVGIDALSIIQEYVGMFPPFGIIFHAVLENANGQSNSIYMSFGIESSLNVAVILLITAAFIVGAYFVGKYRKAERVEQSFVFGGAYHAISLALVAMIIGFIVYFSNNGGLDLVTVLKALGITFFVYLALELSRNKGFKGFWKSLLRYGCVFAASFGFLILMRVTDGFGEQNRIPSVNSIDHVEISGDYFYSTYDSDSPDNNISDKSSISQITETHRKLLDNADKLSTGDMFKLTYTTNSGREIKRFYSCEREENNIIKQASDEVKKLGFSVGDLDDLVYDDTTIYYNSRSADDPNQHMIRAEKIEKFCEILRNDVIWNYDYSIDSHHSYIPQKKQGEVTFRSRSGGKYFGSYSILPTYKDTIAFLKDTDNFLNASEVKENEKYNIYYRTLDGFNIDLEIDINSDDESEAAQRFIELVKSREPGTEYSDLFYIYGKNGNYGISKEDETEALEALVEVFLEKTAQ